MIVSRPRIGIGFFGIPRSGALAFDSVRQNILEVASRLGDICVRYHFFKQNKVVNLRSGENGELPYCDYEPFEAFQGILEDAQVINNVFNVERIFQGGDAWSDGFASTTNLLRQLHSLRVVTNQLNDFCPDVIVFVRPDLIYYDSFENVLKKALKYKHRSIVRLPRWDWYGGYNDRFSICSGCAMTAYGMRAEKVYDYLLTTGRPLHSECFLKYSLDSSLCSIHPFGLKASRVRLGGKIVNERFKAVNGLSLIKFMAREFSKELIRSL